MRYVCGHPGQGLLVLFAVFALTFALAGTPPGSFPVELRLNPRISPATPAMTDRYGLDESLEKYVHLLQSVRNTLLTVTATALAWLMALDVGAWAANRIFWRGGPPGARR